MLHTEPSFSIYADEDGFLEKEKGDLGIKTCEGMDGCEFTFAKRSIQMGLIVEGDEDADKSSGFKNLGSEEENRKDEIEPPSPKMYLATGLGIDGNMGGFNESGDIEEYYKMMMMSKGDLTGTEDFYLRATIEDPNDCEILMRYAKLVWELHRDQDRALSYFEKAVYAAPGDCNILAAYASFLWDIDQVQDEDYGLITQLYLHELLLLVIFFSS